MNKKQFLLFACSLLMYGTIWSQNSLSLQPNAISPSAFSLTVSIAGKGLADPLVNYTNQSIKYNWPFLGEGLVGSIYISSQSIPNGISVIVEANKNTTGGGGFAKGTPQGPKTVSTSYQALVTGIWSANTVIRPLTQNIIINNFANLHPGTYPVVLTYIMQ